jgi:hypothetical protein
LIYRFNGGGDMDKTRQDGLVQEIKSSLTKAEKTLSKQKRVNTTLLIAGMMSSAAATLVAGITAASGPVIGTGTEGWRVACIIAAIFGFGATVSNGLGQQLKVNEGLIECSHCVNQLRSLNLGITSGLINGPDIAQEYQAIASSFPDYI